MKRRRRTWLLVCGICGLEMRGVVDAARQGTDEDEITFVLRQPKVVKHMRSCSLVEPAS